MDPKDHWERVYSKTPVTQLGWYQPHLETPLEWILNLGLPPGASIIDVGGGASTLVDDLLEKGDLSLTVLDLSGKALKESIDRLGDAAKKVTWLEGDITRLEIPTGAYDLWHDRAVFHFLTGGDQKRKYRENLMRGLKPGGWLIIGAFAPEAPPKCSGLPVDRYTPEELETTLGGNDLILRRAEKELHITPTGVEQMYVYCCFQRIEPGS